MDVEFFPFDEQAKSLFCLLLDRLTDIGVNVWLSFVYRVENNVLQIDRNSTPKPHPCSSQAQPK